MKQRTDIVDTSLTGMTYYSQDKPYTCAAATLRMAMSRFFESVPSEDELCARLGTSEAIGTHPDKIISVAKDYGFSVLHGQDGDLDTLDGLILDGYVVMLAISVDVPHFVVYLGSNGSHSFFHDPFFGAKLARDKAKWISDKQKYPFYRWRVVPAEFFPEYDFSSQEGYASSRFYIAVKK